MPETSAGVIPALSDDEMGERVGAQSVQRGAADTHPHEAIEI